MPGALTAVLAQRGITTPTPIQAATLPDALAGRDVLGRGRTGSGKTYAFLLPLLARLHAASSRPKPGRPRALILAPTRELVDQIDAALAPLAGPLRLRSRTVYGGTNQNPQVRALRDGVDIVVACPGRLEDLIRQGHCRLDAVEITVLDEADHMADLGFLPVVRRLLDATPATGQRLLFSATLDAAVDGLVRRFLHHPATHEADSAQSPVGTMTHRVLRIADAGHVGALVDLTATADRTVVFTRTKSRAKRLAKQLNNAGVSSVELHGNLSQNARTRAMAAFHGGQAKALVATDIAARGIHVDDVSLVVHADPPTEHKAYLHRSGRTARAGASGTVVTLATAAQAGEVAALLRKAGVRVEHEVEHQAGQHQSAAAPLVSVRARDGQPPRESRSPRHAPSRPRRAGQGSRAGQARASQGQGSGQGQRPSQGQVQVQRQGVPPRERTSVGVGAGQGQSSGQRTGQRSGPRRATRPRTQAPVPQSA